eukprot:5038109-Prymnesium_polylepis.2
MPPVAALEIECPHGCIGRATDASQRVARRALGRGQVGVKSIVTSSAQGAARRTGRIDGRTARILAQFTGAAPCVTAGIWLEAIVAHARAFVRTHLAECAIRRLHGLAVVGSREGEGRIRRPRPALRPAARRLIAAARRPQPHS